jgi:3-oxoacyl-[acyl-carrier protein] reductase
MRSKSERLARWVGTVRNVIVTGGSRGLGLAIVRDLHSAGYHVVALARLATPQLTEVLATTGRVGRASFVKADLREIDAIPDLVKRIRQEFGPIYGLVNNAAVGRDGVLATMHNSEIEDVLRLNTLAPIVLTKYVVRGMIGKQGGRVVNVSSIIASTGYSGLSVYGASKAALVGFTRSLARELGRANITVNAVAPGYMQTDMTSGLSDKQREQIANRSALRRLTSAEDVAHAVTYLLSEKAGSITGTVLTIDAGSSV